jgi:hypothetical protein
LGQPSSGPQWIGTGKWVTALWKGSGVEGGGGYNSTFYTCFKGLIQLNNRKSRHTCSNEEDIICFPIWSPYLLIYCYFRKPIPESQRNYLGKHQFIILQCQEINICTTRVLNRWCVLKCSYFQQ